MFNRLVILASTLVAALALIVIPFPEGVVGIAFVVPLAAIAIFLLRQFTEEKEFITTLFLLGLSVRLGFGIFVHVFELRDFFGGDAFTYDNNGAGWVDVWLGHAAPNERLIFQNDPRSGVGWGMNYFTAGIYFLLGRNIFAAQSVCAVVGAATAPMVFFCTKNIYNNLKVAKTTAIAIAVFPSFVIWSSQLLKDGLILFLLVAAMTMVLQLQTRFSYAALGLLLLSLLGIMSLRFYIFYMVLVAVAGSLVVGLAGPQRSVLRSTIVIVLLGGTLTFLGAGERVSVGLAMFGNLERMQLSRSDLALRATSGFGADMDISTPEGAITVLPLGFAYLMFAPFPWEAANLRQAITIPEVLVWWAMLPLLISGLIYTIKNQLRRAFPILIFSLLLTLAYTNFQGNVGTAYRQRTQIQVFLFILI
jgi:hypothetical protein